MSPSEPRPLGCPRCGAFVPWGVTHECRPEYAPAPLTPTGLRQAIERAINSASAENGSNTPDFVLAEYLTDCLAAFDKATLAREKWYGVRLTPGGIIGQAASGPTDKAP